MVLSSCGFLGGDCLDTSIAPEHRARQKFNQESDNSEQGDNDTEHEQPVVNVKDVISDGQEVLVQVSKEPLGTKGPRLTMFVTLPGRYLVIMPFVKHVVLSRRIEDNVERTRPQKIGEKLVEGGDIGIILRTAVRISKKNL